jgi:hypothetical protein
MKQGPVRKFTWTWLVMTNDDGPLDAISGYIKSASRSHFDPYARMVAHTLKDVGIDVHVSTAES